MRGGSHGDWNRFLCSQILGAERDTVLPGGRQPSVSSSKPSKTTPGGMLPGGVAVAVAASPWGLRTPGWALPCDYWHGRSRGTGCTFEARMRLRRAPTCTGGPEADQRVRSPRECVGLGGPEIPWPKGAPLSPARRSTVTTWSSYWSGWGQEGWRWHVLASSSCRYPTGSGPMPAVWCCGVTTAGRPPSYIYLGKCLAGCCYLSFSAPVGINSTWLKPFVSEVGPVDRFSNLGKFRATWSQFRGVACL